MTISHPRTSDCVLLLKMDESSGNALDSSGNGYTFTQVGTVPAQTGMINGARGGYSDANYFWRADSAPLRLSTFTISMWIYLLTTAQNNFAKPFCKDWSGDNDISWAVMTDNSGQSVFRFAGWNTGKTVGFEAKYNSALSVGWHHLTATFDISGSVQASFYVDGILRATHTPGASFGSIRMDAGNWGIGRDQFANMWFNGYVDDVAMYNTVKSACWVKNAYERNNDLTVEDNIVRSDFSINKQFHLDEQFDTCGNIQMPFIYGSKKYYIRQQRTPYSSSLG